MSFDLFKSRSILGHRMLKLRNISSYLPSNLSYSVPLQWTTSIQIGFIINLAAFQIIVDTNIISQSSVYGFHAWAYYTMPQQISYRPVSDSPDATYHLIFFITGNPGLIGYQYFIVFRCNVTLLTLLKLLLSLHPQRSSLSFTHERSEYLPHLWSIPSWLRD